MHKAQPVAITVQLDPGTGQITGSSMTYLLTLPDGTTITRQQDMGGWGLDPAAGTVADIAKLACGALPRFLRASGFEMPEEAVA